MYDDDKFNRGSANPRPKGFFISIMVLLGIIIVIGLVGMQGREEEISLKKFSDILKENPEELRDVVYEEDEGYYFSRKGDAKGKRYFVQTGEDFERNPKYMEIAEKVDVQVKRKNKFVTEILPNILVILGIFFLIYFFFFRNLGKRGEGFMSFGKSRAKLVNPEMCETTFDDVAGIEEAVDEVKEVVDFLKNPDSYNRLGGRLPRGILLVGNPGVGKTLLAKAIAGEAGVPFFSISGSDFVELFVGVGASRVRDLFSKAKEKAPSIIFLDELDAIGRRRGTGLGGGHDEREQTLNSILVEMDGFERKTNVIILAATNREDVLDPALLRPGRFDRQIQVPLPDIKGREEILKVHSRDIVLSDKVDLKIIARSTPMASGADLENILNEAALIAVMEGKNEVDMEALEKAREKIMWGKAQKSRVMSDEDRKVTALHESGHAVCAKVIPEVDPLHKVSIIPRGSSLGITMMLPEKERYSVGRKKFLANVSVMLAGRVAEELYGEDITSGAADDLKKATRLVRKMVCEWGMSENVGIANYSNSDDHVFLGQELSREKKFSEHTQQKIDDEVEKILSECRSRAESILKEKKDIIMKMIDLLLEVETLDSEQLDVLFKGEDPLKGLRKKDKGSSQQQEASSDDTYETEEDAESASVESPESREESEDG